MGTVDVKQAVIDSTLEIVATEGPDAVSMREVARRAGISHQAPYHHFGDRAGIFAAITEEGFKELASSFRSTDGISDTYARQCLRTYVSLAITHPGHFRVMFRRDICGLGSHAGATAAADAAYAELELLVKRTIGDEAGIDELTTWSTMLWSSAHGLATLLLDGPLLAKIPAGMSTDELIDRVVTLMGDMVDEHARLAGFTGAS